MDPITLLVIGLICIGIGIFIGLLIGSLSKDKRESETPAEISGDEDIFRLWRKPGGIFGIYFGGRTFDMPGDIPTSVVHNIYKVLREVFPTFDKSLDGPSPDLSLDQQASGTISVLDDGFEKTISEDSTDDPPDSPTIEESIALQIDAVLQEKLSRLNMLETGVKLFEIPGKGMVVMVGLDQYDDVESVPDEAIRNIIKEAVKQWEEGVGG